MRMPDKAKRLHFPRRGLAAGLALFLCLCPTPVCAADGEPTATGGQSGTPVPAALTEVQESRARFRAASKEQMQAQRQQLNESAAEKSEGQR